MAKHNFYGKFAEIFAKIILVLKGYNIINANLKQQYKGIGIGEVDIIAVKNKTIIFIEVKKRKTLPLALEALCRKQQLRILKASEIFIKYNPDFNNYDIRFDAFAIGNFFLFKHIKNAWRL